MRFSSRSVTSLAVAFLSICGMGGSEAAPTNLAKPMSVTAPWRGCSVSGGYSSTCINSRNYKTYNACVDGVLKNGWRSPDATWFCSSLGLQ